MHAGQDHASHVKSEGDAQHARKDSVSRMMRQVSFGMQTEFRFNLRTDHSIRDIARYYHELAPTLLWVDSNPSEDNKVPECPLPPLVELLMPTRTPSSFARATFNCVCFRNNLDAAED